MGGFLQSSDSAMNLPEQQKSQSRLSEKGKALAKTIVLATALQTSMVLADVKNSNPDFQAPSHDTVATQVGDTTQAASAALLALAEETEVSEVNTNLQYLNSININLDENNYLFRDAPEPLTGVVETGKEYIVDYSGIEDLGIPEEITRENILALYDALLQERPDESDEVPHKERWNNKLVELGADNGEVQDDSDVETETTPKLIDDVIVSLEAYFAQLKSYSAEGEDYVAEGGYNIINKLLVERAIKSIPTLQIHFQNWETFGELEDQEKLNFMSDIYYLFVALDVDMRGSAFEVQDSSKTVSNIIPVIDKAKALILSDFGMKVPVELIEGYNEVYADFLKEGRILGDKGIDKPNRFAKYEDKFNNLSPDEQLFALKVYDAGDNDVEAKKTDGWLAVNIIKMLERINHLRYIVSTGDIREGEAYDGHFIAKSIVFKFPQTQSILTKDFTEELDLAFSQIDGSMERRGDKIRELNAKIKLLLAIN